MNYSLDMQVVLARARLYALIEDRTRDALGEITLNFREARKRLLPADGVPEAPASAYPIQGVCACGPERHPDCDAGCVARGVEAYRFSSNPLDYPPEERTALGTSGVTEAPATTGMLFKLIDAKNALQHAAASANPDVAKVYRQRALELAEIASVLAHGVDGPDDKTKT